MKEANVDLELKRKMFPLFKATVRKKVNIIFNFFFYGGEKIS